MEATAFCLSHPPSISDLPLKYSSSLKLFASKNHTTTPISYRSNNSFSRTKQLQHLSCTTNYKQHLISFFPKSFTSVRPHRFTFHPTTCAINNDGMVPRKDKGNGNKKSETHMVRGLASVTVVLACTVLGIIMSSNGGRLLQANNNKAYINPGLHQDEQMIMMTATMSSLSNLWSQNQDLLTAYGIPYTSTIPEIKKKALSMAPEEAIKMLKLAYKEISEKEKTQERADQIELLLVERLIHKGYYNEALGRKCMTSIQSPEDAANSVLAMATGADVYLYKTFLYAMTDDKGKAKIWFEALQKKLETAKFHRRLLSIVDDDQDQERD